MVGLVRLEREDLHRGEQVVVTWEYRLISIVHSVIAADHIPGALGIFRYTGDDIAKSLNRAVHQTTIKRLW